MNLIIDAGIILGICTYTLYASCGEPENIPNATNNATDVSTYAENVTVTYDCNAGYRNVGNKHYICIDGQWSYGDIICNKIFCPDVEVPENAKRVGNYERSVGTWAKFECKPGYDMVGTSSMLCRVDGEWRPKTPPTCEPKSCGDFGYIENGETFQSSLIGRYNIYGNVIYVSCDEGYMLMGSSQVTCTADGLWDSRPTCEMTSCPQFPGLNSSCIADSSLNSDGTLLTLLCKETTDLVSVTDVGQGTAFCFEGIWDDVTTACYCDCKIDTGFEFFSTNGLVNGFLKHGETLQWTCDPGYRKNTLEIIRCNDGDLNFQPLCRMLEKSTTGAVTKNDSNFVSTEDPNIKGTMYNDISNNGISTNEMTSDVAIIERETTQPSDEVSSENVKIKTEETIRSTVTSTTNKISNILTSTKYDGKSNLVRTDSQETTSTSNAVFNARISKIFVLFFLSIALYF